MNIIAIDGEGKDNSDGQHLYTLLAASTGAYIERQDISTEEVFSWLLSLPKGLFVGYSIEYDANMWLRDVPLRFLDALHTHGEVHWNGYDLTWWHGRKFTIRRGKQSRTVWDVFRFFQKSFVNSLHEWSIGDEVTVARIQSMKEQRGSFAQVDNADIRRYCFEECDLLVELTRKLLATCESVGLKLHSYHGPGALAAAAMRKHGVAKYMADPPKAVDRAVRFAYYGGRFETAELGRFDTLHSYDINSAYPHVLRSCPCLHCGRWERWQRGESISRWGVYRVHWELGSQVRWAPFPFRTSELPLGPKELHRCGPKIFYPIAGENWYWGSEVVSALRLYPERITVVDGWRYDTNCHHRPFGFVDHYYDEKARLKELDDYGWLILKNTVNSLYGKTAQHPIDHRVPPYLSYVWAGMTTAGCRAMLLDAIAQNPDAIVSVATDGLLSREPLSLDEGPGLGQWKHEVVTDAFTLQNGVYSYHVPHKHDRACREHCAVRTDEISHTRGYTRRDFDWNELRNEWDRSAPFLTVEKQIRRFNGVGWALQQKDKLKDWRRWTLHTRTIAADFGTRVSFDGYTSWSVWDASSCRALPVQPVAVVEEDEFED